ncbi:MAG TPA: Dam family site-specific DNA-(adenine-N6)-methyltransferase [Thermoanaerobaculia bacterium]|jgi:DNA adenine methylase|nr:Dam family site-specific DNA-(adenine-N6)-methyltransferase [Thermoanaerobaculia bacterium]
MPPVKARPWSRSIIRWAGSKRLLLPALTDLIGGRPKRYIEPFCGSAALFFAMRPQAAVLGDLNADLIHAYTVLRRHPRILWRAVTALRSEDYYEIRGQSPEQLDNLSRAARFLYLNRYCFNAVYRTNRRGEFNVPRGTASGGVPSEILFYRCAVALRNSTLLCADFTRTIEGTTEGDVVYLDPPYDLASRQRYGEYGYGSFGRDDVHRLVSAVRMIDGRRAFFVLSYFDDPLLRAELASYRTITIDVPRHVAGFARARQRAHELLITNLKPLVS